MPYFGIGKYKYDTTSKIALGHCRRQFSRKRIPKSLIYLLLAGVTVGLISWAVFLFAANIDATNKYSYGENIGWQNWSPTHGGGVTVTTDGLSGYVWAGNIGWIKLADDTTGAAAPYENDRNDTDDDSDGVADDWGVNNDGVGNLSGYAWSENAGWINFNSTHSQVTIDADAKFSGYAWSESVGWIKLAGTATDTTEYYVKTSWLPPTITTANITVTGATGTGDVFIIDDVMRVVWDNSSATGDDNPSITGVTCNFSNVGGGSSVAANDSQTGGDVLAGDDKWTAQYTLLGAGDKDNVGTTVSVTATNAEEASGSANSSIIDVDNVAPAAPTNPLVSSAGNGISNAEEIAGFTVTVDLTGTNAVADDELKLLLDSSSFKTFTLTATEITNTSYAFSIAHGDLGADGDKELTGRVTDIAGNVGTEGATLTLNLGTALDHYDIDEPTSATAGSNFTVTITPHDAYDSSVNGDATVTLSAETSAGMPGTGILSSDVYGTLVINTSSGGAMAVADLQYTKAENIKIKATDGTKTSTFADITNTIVVSATSICKFTLTPPADILAGTRAEYTVTRKDEFDNPGTSGPETVYLYASPTGTNSAFYDVATGGTPVTSIPIADTASTATFWYEEQLVGTYTITASDNLSAPDGTDNIDDAEDTLGVNPAAIHDYTVTPTSPETQTAGTGFTETVTAYDEYDHVVTTDSTTVIAMTNSGSAKFYPDNTYDTTSETYTRTQTTDADFNAGTPSSVTVSGGDVTLEEVVLTVTDIDDNTYNTVVIGDQIWTKENMRTTKYPDGTAITKGCATEADCDGTGPLFWGDDTALYSCPPNYPANDAEDCNAAYPTEKLGLLYQWSAATQSASSCNGIGESQPACDTPVQGICPDGWHIPSHYEYVALARQVCTSDSETCATNFPYDTTFGWTGTNEGTALKSGGSSGFEALLPGVRNNAGGFDSRGTITQLWTSFWPGSNSAWQRYLQSSRTDLNRSRYGIAYGFSVRCLKNTSDYDSYVTSGTLESSPENLSAPKNFTSISWTATTPTTDTTVKFQIATNDGGSTWTFIGPDGTVGSYYTVSGQKTHSSHNGNQYVKYKATLEGDGSATPTLSDVTISDAPEITAYTLDSGLATIYVKDTVAQTITITATDNNTKTGTSGNITVNPAAIASYTVPGPTPQTAGTGWSETITALDAHSNTVTTDSSTAIAMTNTGSAKFYPDANYGATAGTSYTWEQTTDAHFNAGTATNVSVSGDSVTLQLQAADTYTKLLLHMDDTGLTDSSLNEHNVTLNDNATRSPEQSKFGGYSAYFDGSGDYLSILDSVDWDFGTGDFTIDMWINFAVSPGTAVFISKGTDGAHTFQCHDGNIEFYDVENGGYVFQQAWSYTTNTWHHLALVRNESNLYLYKNGEQFSSGSLITSVDWSGDTIGIGAHSNGQYPLNGYIDEVRISKGIARWTENFTPPTSAYSEVYSTSGTLESSPKNLGATKNFTSISWTATTPTEDTTVKFQIATNNDTATWNFIGPDGTTGTYYTVSGQKTHSSHDNNQYIKYKATLETTDTSVTPTLSDVTITDSPEVTAYTLTSGEAAIYVKDTVAETITITATDNNTKTGTSGNITVNPADRHHYKVTAAVSDTTAGVVGGVEITITSYDTYDNVNTLFNATDQSIVFSGASIAPDGATYPTCSNVTPVDTNFGDGTLLDFSTGATTSTMKLYAAETAHIKATQGAITTSNANDLDISVTGGTATKLTFNTENLPVTTVVKSAPWPVFIIDVSDAYENATSEAVAVTIEPVGATALPLGGTSTVTSSSSTGQAIFGNVTYPEATALLQVKATATAAGLTEATYDPEITVLEKYNVIWNLLDYVYGTGLSSVTVNIWDGAGARVTDSVPVSSGDVVNSGFSVYLPYDSTGYNFEFSRAAYIVSTESDKLLSSTVDGADGTYDGTITFSLIMMSVLEYQADYKVQADFIYDEDTDKLNITTRLERRSQWITSDSINKLWASYVRLYDGEALITLSDDSADGQGNYWFEVSDVTVATASGGLGLIGGKSYFAKCEINYGGTTSGDAHTYYSGTTFDIGVTARLKVWIEQIKDEVSGVVDTVETEADLTRGAVTIATSTITDDVADKAEATQSKVTDKAAETMELIGSEDLKTGETLASTLAREAASRILNQESYAKENETLTIRYKTDTGLDPVITVYDADNTLRIDEKVMEEKVSGTGIYEYDVEFEWGLGEHTIICKETTKGTLDGINIEIISTDLEEISTAVTTTMAQLASIDTGEMETLSASIESINSVISRIVGNIDELSQLSTRIRQLSEQTTTAIYSELELAAEKLEEINEGQGIKIEKMYEMSEDQSGDVDYIKNKTLEIKALVELSQEILARTGDEPIVKTWLESSPKE